MDKKCSKKHPKALFLLGFQQVFPYLYYMENSAEATAFDTETVTIPKKVHEQLLEQVQQSQNLQIKIDTLEHQLAELKRMIFGSKSERFVPASSDQLALGLDIGDPQQPVAEEQTVSYSRRIPRKKDKKGHSRLPIPSHIPRVETDIYPKEDITGARKIGEAITEVLEYKPGTFYVKKFIRHKYVLPTVPERVVIGELPSLPIPKGNAGPGLLAHIMVSKYVDHLPFYRQKKIFKRQDIEISQSTFNGWFVASCRLLEPLYEVLRKKIRQVDYLMADETPIPVLTKDRPGSAHKGYFWVYYDPLGGNACFDYRPGRGRKGPNEFLEGFKGALQTDAYVAYDIYEKNPDVALLGCIAHCRRKFEHALDNDRQRSEHALELFGKLYAIERRAREENLPHGDRKLLRDQQSRPVLDEMKQWLEKGLYRVLPDSVIGKAMAYTYKLWPRLVRYLDDGRYEPDTNLVENQIRVPVLGRKNYMFAGSHKGARRAAMMYSFLGSCKSHNVDPFAWLSDVLERISDHKASKLEELLPQNWKPTE